jgi:hypothetical protein
MANGKSGAFGSRKGIKTPAVMVQGNQLRVAKDPAPWFADFDSLAAQCTALTTSPAMIMPYFGDAELMAKIDRQGVNDATKALMEQIKQQKERLAALVAETKAMREGVPAMDGKPARAPITKVTQDNTIELLNHGEQFQTFMDDWLRIIYFSMDKVLDFFRALGQDIPVLCPYSQGFVKTEQNMTPEELKAASGASLDELAAEVAEEDHLGKMILGVLQAAPLKAHQRKAFAKMIEVTPEQFNKLIKGDYRQFSLTKLRSIHEKMDGPAYEQELAAVEQTELQQMAEAAESTTQKVE